MVLKILVAGVDVDPIVPAADMAEGVVDQLGQTSSASAREHGPLSWQHPTAYEERALLSQKISTISAAVVGRPIDASSRSRPSSFPAHAALPSRLITATPA